jgi:hypothetical protein
LEIYDHKGGKLKQFALVSADGQIASVVSPGRDDDYYDTQQVGDLIAYEISPSLDQASFLATYYRKDNEWRVKPPSPGSYYYWDLNSESWVLNSTELYRLLRQQRDGLLFTCDWTQLPDAPIAAEKKAEWTAYRQALRDIPQNYPNLTSLDEVVWPTPPAS